MSDEIELLTTPGFVVRTLRLRDAEALSDYHRRNEEYHREWSPIPPADFFTTRYQRDRLLVWLESARQGREYRFGIFTEQPGAELVGAISFAGIERGAFENGRLGYSIDVAHRSRGLMSASVEAVVVFAFERLGLHRVEANIMPRNTASRRVLEKCSFTRIGTSPRMLRINGVWEDHDMYMRLADEE